MRFTLVGLLGFGLQLALLMSLTHRGVPYVVAIAVAVEAAILHNFVWHERWTWRTRVSTKRWRRLGRFHVLNGFVSLGGNLLLTPLFVHAGLRLAAANTVAVLTCALLNFAGADRLVFSRKMTASGFGEEDSECVL